MVIKLTAVFQLFFFRKKNLNAFFFCFLLLVLQGCQEHNPAGERINGCIYFNYETYIIICVIVFVFVFVLIPSFCCVLFVCVIQIGSRLSLRRNSGVKDNKFGVDAQALMLKGVKEAYLCYQGGDSLLISSHQAYLSSLTFPSKKTKPIRPKKLLLSSPSHKLTFKNPHG